MTKEDHIRRSQGEVRRVEEPYKEMHKKSKNHIRRSKKSTKHIRGCMTKKDHIRRSPGAVRRSRRTI